MIEFPEALIIGRQMNAELEDKQIISGNQGNSPHKFAFVSKDQDYATIFQDKTVGQSWGHGSAILTRLEPGYTLVLGGGGERITYHQAGGKLPKKYQLHLTFADESFLSVTVQGWGNVLLLPQETTGQHRHVQENRINPLDEAFTWDYFARLFHDEPESKKSIKYFLISEPGVWGIGNGCLQDILFYARIHPRRKIIDMDEEEQHTLYEALQNTLTKMIEQGGRYSERDLYGSRGGYVRLMDSKTKGQPCPQCGTLIEKAQYLGGAIYYCPTCQT